MCASRPSVCMTFAIFSLGPRCERPYNGQGKWGQLTHNLQAEQVKPGIDINGAILAQFCELLYHRFRLLHNLRHGL
jgi:hypothetical protein